MRPLEELYEQGRDRVSRLVADADPEALEAPVPSCPAWSVRDVVAHLAGLCTDIVTGNVAGAATDVWTDAQVTGRRGVAFSDVLGEWKTVGPQVAAMLDDFPGHYGPQVITDLAVHEHDIRGALCRPGARESESVAAGLDFLLSTLVYPEATAL